MALLAGDAFADPPTGLASEIYTELDGALTTHVPGYSAEDGENALRSISNGLAEAIVSHLIANLELNLSGVSSGGASVTVNAPDAVS